MKDIAKAAGVSYGTVSNVLNHRGNTSSIKIRLVEEAAGRLGYSTNAQAQKMRKEHNRHLAIILPDITGETYALFYTSLRTLSEEYQYDTSLYLTYSSPEAERGYIRAALSNRPRYIITVSCMDNYEEYASLNTKMIIINNHAINPAHNQISFSFDFSGAGVIFSEKIIRKGYKKIACFFDSAVLPAHRLFLESLAKKLRSKGVEITPFYYDFQQTYHGAIAVLEQEIPFDLVITHNRLYLDKLRYARELLDCKLPKLMNFGINETFLSSNYLQYGFDYRAMAQQVFSAIRHDEAFLGKSFFIKTKGFIPERGEPGTVRHQDIRMLTVKSPIADILLTLSPYLKKCTGISLKIIAVPYEEVFSILSENQPSNFDLIRIDMARSAQFDRDFFLPLNRILNRITNLAESFLPPIRSIYCPNLDNAFCIPLDPSIQILFYRRDLFENPTIRRLFYEQTRKHLEIPEDYSAYKRIAAFFTSRINNASPVTFGTTMTYGAASVAACDILHRIKSLGGEVFDSEGYIHINTPIFHQALNDYLALKEYSNKQVLYWWDDTVETFIKGQAAMTIVFINHVSRIIRSKDAEFSGKVGTAPVPGNYPLLAGGCIGISNQSRNVEGCIDFFNWVYSDEIANMITLLGGLSPCNSVFENEEILEVYPWLRNIGEYFNQGWRRISSPRFPNFDNHKFERIFGSAVRNAALGVTSIQEALEYAQRECEKAFPAGL